MTNIVMPWKWHENGQNKNVVEFLKLPKQLFEKKMAWKKVISMKSSL